MPAPLRPPKLVNLRVNGPGLLDRRGRFFDARGEELGQLRFGGLPVDRRAKLCPPSK
jgi:hypothetical protein